MATTEVSDPALAPVFAPAKINLTLHVTGQRADGYHLLDSIVAFADVGDVIRVRPSDQMRLTVTGPKASGVPTDRSNLCWRAAEPFDLPVAIELEKHLPAAAGIGGGSSDAAAVIRAMETLTGRAAPFDPIELGADLPVCCHASAAHMQGIGEQLRPWPLPRLHAVLVNPGIEVPTGPVFAALPQKTNPAMQPWPHGAPQMAAKSVAHTLHWLAQQRNDLQLAAISVRSEVGDVLNALSGLHQQQLVRMSGSGATCFALFLTRDQAQTAAQRLQTAHPGWWVTACTLS